jgi:non-ribosomal peptide synthetase component F
MSQTQQANPATQTFWAARDTLLAHRDDHAAACANFRWPQLTEFNWALDHFDVLAQDNDRTALCIVQEDGSHERLSFVQMAARSNQVANWFRQLGVRRGDRVLLMLGNQRELWESMLALMKLGAVMIPTTTLLDQGDLQDRLDRGHVRHVICVPDAVARVQTGQRRRPTRCFCTSPPAPPPSPSWCCTRRKATRWATCRPCTGSACGRGMCT